MTDLQERIAARIQEAKDKGIAEAAILVAETLGHKNKHPDQEYSSYYEYLVGESGFECRFEKHFGDDDTSTTQYVIVKSWDKKLFVQKSGEITTYAGGDWEKRLFALAEKAKARVANIGDEIAKQEAAKRAELANWGLEGS